MALLQKFSSKRIALYIYICVLVSLQILPKTGSELASTERHSTFAPCNNLEVFHPWHQWPRSTAVTKKSQVELRGYYEILQVFTRGVLKKTQVIVIVCHSSHNRLGSLGLWDLFVEISSWELRFLCSSLFIKMAHILSDCLELDLCWIFQNKKTWATWS